MEDMVQPSKMKELRLVYRKYLNAMVQSIDIDVLVVLVLADAEL